MKTRKAILPIAAMVAASCCVLFAGELEQKAFDASDFGLTNMTADIAVPVPQPESAGGQQDETDRFFKYFDDMFAAPIASPLGLAGNKSVADVSESRLGAVVYSVKLEPIRNAFLYSGMTFKTSRGAAVHLSGHKASNCPDGGNSCSEKDKFFMVLTTQRGESYFIRGMEIVNYGIFMRGSKTVVIDGEKFTAKVYASLRDPASSKIEITCGGRKALVVTAQQLGEAIAEKGVDVKLERGYKLAYGNELVQGKGFAKFTDKKLVLLMPFPLAEGAVSYFLLDSAEIKPSGVSYPEMDARYGFRIINGTLEIFELK
ncbi:MAG: hypothetical protein KKH28_02475 [Elusimicrobia bacterium]|nr:hypothetical protein [Elusimicrobiota bacterium]